MCDNYPVIPQFGGTCWFNVIITACCYSENLKKLMITKSKNWDKSNSFFKYLKTILKYSYSTDSKTKRMFIKQKPEYLLFKYLNYFDKSLKRIMRLMIHYYLNDISLLVYYNINYIITFFRKIGINCLDIIILDNNEYLVDFDKNINLNLKMEKINKKDYSFSIDDKYEFKYNKFEIKNKIKKPDLTTIPEVIIIQPSNTFRTYIPDSQLYKYGIKKSNLNLIFNNNDYIEYKGYKYKLDAYILQNYNSKFLNHVILGMTCNNKRYVYNSFNNNKNKFKSFPCGFYKFNWNINKNKEFYFDYNKCKIKGINDTNRNKIEKDKQTFSFNKGKRLFIYVKINENDNHKNHKNDNDNDYDNSYRSISKKEEMMKSFYDIKNIPLRNLRIILANLNYSENYLKGKSKEFLLKLLEKKI
jgi:hypothetical protein